jgi:hypothetical protein
MCFKVEAGNFTTLVRSLTQCWQKYVDNDGDFVEK